MKRLLIIIAAAALCVMAPAGASWATAPDCVPRDSIPPTEVTEIRYHKLHQTRSGWTTQHPNYAISDWIPEPTDGQVVGLTSSGTYTLGEPFSIGGGIYKYDVADSRVVVTDPGDPGNVPPDECTTTTTEASTTTLAPTTTTDAPPDTAYPPVPPTTVGPEDDGPIVTEIPPSSPPATDPAPAPTGPAKVTVCAGADPGACSLPATGGTSGLAVIAGLVLLGGVLMLITKTIVSRFFS